MKSGWNSSWRPRSTSSSLRSAPEAGLVQGRPPLRMYHWREVTISRGLSPFSKKFVWRTVLVGSPLSSPLPRRRATTASRAENVVLPEISAKAVRPASVVIHSGVSATMRPSLRRIARSGRPRSRHQSMSVVSPKVQHMAMPAPLSFSAAGWARTGTSTP